MPLDFRYHLASLTAVFGALLIGILAGIAMKEGPALSKQVTQLRAEFKRSEALRHVDERADRFTTRTQAPLVRDRLAGRNVALIIDAASFPPEKAEAVAQTLRQAGANLTVTLTLKPALLLLSTEQTASIYTELGAEPPAKPGPAELMTRLGGDLGRGWTTVATVLQNQKLLAVTGDPAQPVSAVVLLGGGPPKKAESPVQRVEVPFLRACAGRQLCLVACETFDAPVSAIPTYKTVADITIDNIDHAAGRVALVLALSGTPRGNYGYKKTADDVSPEVK